MTKKNIMYQKRNASSSKSSQLFKQEQEKLEMELDYFNAEEKALLNALKKLHEIIILPDDNPQIEKSLIYDVFEEYENEERENIAFRLKEEFEQRIKLESLFINKDKYPAFEMRSLLQIWLKDNLGSLEKTINSLQQLSKDSS